MAKIEKYIKEQERLAKKIVLNDSFGEIKTIAGVDQAFVGNNVISGIVVLSYPDLKVIKKKWATKKSDFPYIPGLLTYKEGPSIVEAYKKLKIQPDILIVDGSGIAHPRGIGLASHIGLVLDKPTVGVTKTKLVGEYEKTKEYSKLIYEGKHVGYILKRKKYKPIFISPGHKISLETSLKIVRNCLKNRLPEPIKIAHEYVNEVKRNAFPKNR
jgi:deoxyribonuclease V